MSDAAGQLPQRLHLLGLDQLLLRALQLQLRLSPVGDVAGDLGEAEQPALGVADGVDQHAGPEHRAVLAHAPALGLVLPFGHGAVQRLDRHAGPAVGVGIELGEVLTDDLVGRVTFDPFGAGVPVGDDAVRIQHDQGDVGHALHEHPELPLALEQGLLGRLALGDVAQGVDEADHLAGVVADGLQRRLGPETAAVLAAAPALALEASAGQGGRQRPLRQAAAAIFFGVEAREVLADDLVGLMTGDPLGAGVPAGHQAVRIHHEDGVVRDRVDKQLEAPILRNGN